MHTTWPIAVATCDGNDFITRDDTTMKAVLFDEFLLHDYYRARDNGRLKGKYLLLAYRITLIQLRAMANI